LHIFYFYKNPFLHLAMFTVLAMSFLTFHGLCHYLSKEFQQKLPYLNVLFYHHYKHHVVRSKNFGFGDLTYDFLFGTLDLDPLEFTDEKTKTFDSKYFIRPIS